MKKIILSLSFFFFTIQLPAQESSLDQGMVFFNGSWAEVLVAAKDQNKPVFVDAFADWCGPCKWMDAFVFPDPEAGKFYNENFIVYKFDMEKGEGPEFAQKYKVESYPSYYFFNPEGELMHKSGGSKPVEKFIEDGRNALDPGKALFVLKRKYDSGDRDQDLLYKYALALKNGNMKSSGVVNEYLQTIDKKDYLEQKNWEFIKSMITDIKSPVFEYVLDNRDKFENKFGRYEVDMKITYTTMNYYANKKQWKEFSKPAADFADKYGYDDASILNNIAWAFYQNVDDDILLRRAVLWAKRAAELERNYYNMDTYAALLYKTGKNEEALKIANEALILAEQEKMNSTETLELIKKIKVKE
jgi:thiol-disulfide isomerase/thioredoxin